MAENEVRVMIDEIGKLTHTDMQMAEFYREVLGRLNSPLQAEGMAAWVCDGDSVELLAHKGLEESSLLNGNTTGPQHMGLLDNVRGQGQGIFVPPGQMAEGSEAGNPTEFAVGICPVKLGNDVVALVESFQQLNGNPQHYEQSMKLMAMVAQVVAEFHRNMELRWRRRMDIFSQAINRSLHPIETAFSIANDGRTVVGCDRLSVAIKRGRKYRLEAISGLEQIHRRANEVRALQDLVRRVLATGEPFSYPDPTVEMPPQLEEVVHNYVDESQTRFMTVLPLHETPKSKDLDDPDSQKRPELIGAVIAERFSGEPFSPQRVETIAQHGQRALNNSLNHNRIFLLPLWTAIGNMHWLVRARTLPWTILVVSLIFAAVMGAIFVPQEFKLTAEGTLEPEIKRFVFAPEEGRIQDDLPEHTRHGATVEKGEQLAVMSNTPIDVELQGIIGQINSDGQRVDYLNAMVTTMKPRTQQEKTTYDEYSAELKEKTIWLESLDCFFEAGDVVRLALSWGHISSKGRCHMYVCSEIRCFSFSW